MTSKMRRTAAKNAYKKFKKNFAAAKKIQESRSFAAKLRAEEKGEPTLGARPTFKRWWDGVKKATLASRKNKQVEDLSWDED